MRYKHYARSTAALLLALTLAACGGGGGGSDDDTPTPTAPAFAAATQTWTIALPTGTDKTVCYDFDAGAVAACDSGTTWDFKLDASSSAPTFRSNGGVTNSAGGGAAFAFFDWTELKTWSNATTDPSSGTSVASLYTADAASSIFTQKSWYAYDLEGTHLLYPNYNIYLVNADTSDSTAKTYALQIIGYYGGASGTSSGYPRIRWIDRANAADVRTATIAATDSSAWVYYD
ncbi:MAG: HmuY family protein, partial [Solimonas sp.]